MTLQIKPSETLSWSAIDDAGDLTGVLIEAALSSNDFYYPPTVTATDLSVGSYEISASDTSSFPIGTLACDIKYSIGGLVTHTDTFYVEVIQKVTV